MWRKITLMDYTPQAVRFIMARLMSTVNQGMTDHYMAGEKQYCKYGQTGDLFHQFLILDKNRLVNDLIFEKGDK
jgi:hypothetical protein